MKLSIPYSWLLPKDFFTNWKGAKPNHDIDTSILKQATAEYAKLE